jgi:hypothetical protein
MSISNYNGIYNGSSQSVVIIDTGASKSFGNDNVIYSYDFADNDKNAYNYENHHGGSVAAVSQSVASSVDIIHLKVFKDNAVSASKYHIESALQWVIENSEKYNIAAVNISLAIGNVTSNAYNNTHGDEYQKLDNLDIITVVAAGNDSNKYNTDGINKMAASDNVIAVSAVTVNNEFTSWSQKHSALTDIAALGQNVNVKGHLLSGTSYAAPIIAGAAAIIQQIALEKLGHKISDEQFLELIQKTADKINPETYSSNSASNQPVLSTQSSLAIAGYKQYFTPDKDPGEDITNAYELSPESNQLFIKEKLSSKDLSDHYSFILDTNAVVSISLTDLDADVDLALKNSTGEIIKKEWVWGNGDLDLAEALVAGEKYFIAVDSYDKNLTAYALSIDFNGGINITQNKPIIDYISPENDPGGDLTSAYQLMPGLNKVIINNSLNAEDTKDFYTFSLANKKSITVKLTDLSADVDLFLVDSSGKALSHEWSWGYSDLEITTVLEADKQYYILANSYDKNQTDYKLTIEFTEINPKIKKAPENTETPETPEIDYITPETPETPEIDYITPENDPGEDRHSAYKLSSNNNFLEITESLSAVDDKDFYNFVVKHSTEVTISLTNLDADVDLLLKDSSGENLFHKWEWGNADLQISTTLKESEQYYIYTDSFDKKSTNYTLSIEFINSVSGPTIPTVSNTPDHGDAPLGYAGVNIGNAVNYFLEHSSDYAVI